MIRHFLGLKGMKQKEMLSLVKAGIKVKKNPGRFASSMKNRNLLMLFEAPSLRTRLSFEIGMSQMGGHAIYYQLSESTLGKKEDIREFSRVVSRYADLVMARIYDHGMLEKMAAYSEIPVINGMTNDEHPCQVISDLMTIWEKKKTFNVKLAYLGDGFNNVTHSLLYGCALVGMDISLASPKGKEYEPAVGVVSTAKKFARASGSRIEITNDPKEAAKDADALVIVTEWKEFKDLDINRIKSLMKKPLIFDGRNIFDPKKMKELGFAYVSVGR